MLVSERENLIGVGRTLLTLADGLVRSGFIDPEESLSPVGLIEELAEDVDAANAPSGVDVQRLPLLVLQVVRIAESLGVRPTIASSEDAGSVGVEVADVESGLEFLAQVDQKTSLEIRGVATAISILVDYAFVVVEPFLRESTEQLDVVKITKGVLAVAEVSVRMALSDGERGAMSVEILRRCAENIEAEVKAAEEPKEGTESDES